MSIPDKIKKPYLAQWLFDRNLSVREGAKLFDTTAETLRRAVLPFGDPNFRPPYAALMRRMILISKGEICPNQWFEATARDLAA